MRVVAQRVSKASVSVEGALIASIGRGLYLAFVAEVERVLGRPVPTGAFGADRVVSLKNQGPVTLWLDSRRRE